MQSLATKYRPTTFAEVVGQDTIKTILFQQIQNNTVKNAYLFVGSAGTGKTTCARIFAQELNQHKCLPLEMDAASHSSVDDVKEIIKQAKHKNMLARYNTIVVDECHSISNTGWQAFLKILEEPPADTIFIFCTTDPQKIPKTILSRVQRFDFQKINSLDIRYRLQTILDKEGINKYNCLATEYIAKRANGGMRDAITMLDKCLSYSQELTIDNVLIALGDTDYNTMIKLADSIIIKRESGMEIIEQINMKGKDLKQFLKSFLTFVLDLNKYIILKSFEFLDIPQSFESEIAKLVKYPERCKHLLSTLVKLTSDIKWDNTPKFLIEATLLLEVNE